MRKCCVSDCVLVVLLPCDSCSLRACCRLIVGVGVGVGVGVVVGVLVVVVVPVYGGCVGVLVWVIFPHGPLVWCGVYSPMGLVCVCVGGVWCWCVYTCVRCAHRWVGGVWCVCSVVWCVGDIPPCPPLTPLILVVL